MNIGLVLSGGMAKGAYQIGALRAVSEFIPLEEIKYMSCASVGVLNGFAFATGQLDRAEKMWKSVCTNDTRLLISQILKSSMLQQSIVKLHDPEKPLKSAFYCSLLDIDRRSLVYKNLAKVQDEEIPLYLKASVAMPLYNRAVRLSGASYYDGAMVDNIPVHPLLKHKLDYIICVYFDDTSYKFENTYFDNKIIKLTFPCESLLKQSIVVNRESIDEMIQNGYEKTMHILKSVFFEGYENLEYVYRTIDYMNRSTKSAPFRITGDVLVTNLNKITQRLTKRKIL